MKLPAGITLLACWLLGTAFLPAAPSRLDMFRHLQVLEQGRKKPLDTFARSLLQRLSGRSSINGMDASAWLARVLFTPRESLEDKIFRVDRPEVLAALGISDGKRGRFSFAELRPGLNRLHELAYHYAGQEKMRTGGFEGEIVRLFHSVSAYYGLLDAFAFARPDGAMTGTASREPAIVPLGSDPDEPWLSPAQALARGSFLSAPARKEIELLALAARAYRNGDGQTFDRALEAFDRSLRQRRGTAVVSPWKISLEIAYNRLAPFSKAGMAYGLALLLLFLSLTFRLRFMKRLGALSLLAGLLLHSSGLIARMLIMGRPPATNLYETFVFVSWTAVALGLIMAWLQKQDMALLAGALTGLAFLVIAGGYGIDGDTMGMLVAVLDSNLWLTVHVATIALGYAGCLVAGVIGHALIIQQLLRLRADVMAGTSRSLYAALAFGLVFTSIGTLMGGIWADQSWGRFWGWDPKENGALLIIIWCAVLLHARMAGRIGSLGLAAGGIGAIIAVVLAWFGVNLLGQGLHAYGFTSGASRGLLAFVAAELAFLAVAVPLASKRSRG